MWGDSIGQKLLICSVLVFFTIWISTLATWVTILYARQEGQGKMSGTFSTKSCAQLKDEKGVPATSTGMIGPSSYTGL
jgi:hypothetical protein